MKNGLLLEKREAFGNGLKNGVENTGSKREILMRNRF